MKYLQPLFGSPTPKKNSTQGPARRLQLALLSCAPCPASIEIVSPTVARFAFSCPEVRGGFFLRSLFADKTATFPLNSSPRRLFAMPPCRLLSGLLLLSAFSATLSQSTHASQLLTTHKRIDPGYWGADFETSLSVHDWSKVSHTPPTACTPAVLSHARGAGFPRSRSLDTYRDVRSASSQYGHNQANCG